MQSTLTQHQQQHAQRKPPMPHPPKREWQHVRPSGALIAARNAHRLAAAHPRTMAGAAGRCRQL
jgi:hypothetical protein